MFTEIWKLSVAMRILLKYVQVHIVQSLQLTTFVGESMIWGLKLYILLWQFVWKEGEHRFGFS